MATFVSLVVLVVLVVAFGLRHHYSLASLHAKADSLLASLKSKL